MGSGKKRSMELLLDIICHDIKNINQVGMGYLELLLEDKNLGEKQREYGEKVLKAFQSSARLIENIEKIRQARALKLEPLDLNCIIKEVIEEFSTPAVKDREVKLKIKYSPRKRKNLIINSSPLVRDVFANLLDNAIKHAGKSRVKININIEDYTWRNKEFYKITVEDNGKGMPDDLKKLFNRQVTKLKGLGLYLVKNIVGKTGGKVWVEDRVKGNHAKGARFVVILPKLASFS
ncbi:MAG: HAMP domain-containing sensor histidine kinase [Methanocellales archaeon]